MNAMAKCGVCGHPFHAHNVRPRPVLCVNCYAEKEKKLMAQHPFEEMKSK